jgi:hypothetical protein
MQQQLTWGAGSPGEENWLLSVQSHTEAYYGRLSKAREFTRRAVESARRADSREVAALWQAYAALREAEFGNPSSARQSASAALALAAGRDVTAVTALALARAGDAPHASKLADDLNKEFPLDTIAQGYWLPVIRASLELRANNIAKALDLLEATTPFELGQVHTLGLGMARQGKQATTEFQKIIDHRGIVLNFPLGALAHLGLARGYSLSGDTAKSRSAYQDFLTLWKDADPDIPILKQAKAEYAKLQ